MLRIWMGCGLLAITLWAVQRQRAPTDQPVETVPSQVGAAQPARQSTDEWGTLTGQFLYGGEAPARELLTLNKDVDVCSKNPPRDQSLIVDSETRGLANVVIWLDLKRGEKVAVHPLYAETAKAEVPFDNVECRFEPHLVLLRTTQSLVVGNKDPVPHSAAFFMNRNDPYSALVPPGEPRKKQFPLTENLPVPVSCPIHAWMKAYLLVKDHPYMAVTDAEGRFTIKHLPVGERTFRIWHERPGYLTQVTRNGSQSEWQSGRTTLTLQPGDNSLGTITVAPSTLETSN